MKKLRDLGIGCVGIARARSGWPPVELSEEAIKKKYKNVTFNHCYWTVDKLGTLVSRWMDNKFVIMVSTVHNIVDTVVSGRRRPRVTLLNKVHVDEVWGTQGKLLFFYYNVFY